MSDRIRITPPNSVLRTLNYFTSGKREILDESGYSLGFVDNTRKYRSGTFAVLSVFECFVDIVETESRDVLKVTMERLRFSDDVGSGAFLISYAIDDVDQYAANGDSMPMRINKVKAALEAEIYSMIEAKTSCERIKDATISLPEISKKITQSFLKARSNIEIRLGVKIQFVTLSDFSESARHQKAISAQGATDILMEKASELLQIAKDLGDSDMTLDRAIQTIMVISGYSGSQNYNIDLRASLPEMIKTGLLKAK